MYKRFYLLVVFICSLFLVTAAVGGPLLAEEEEFEPMPEEYLLPEEPDEPLDFEEIEVEVLSETEAVVEVKLNHPAYARIEYGPGDELTDDRSMMRGTDEHSFRLSGLIEGTEYTYQVQAWVSPQAGVRTDRHQFRTEGTPPPDFESIDVTDRHRKGAVIEWRTNIPTKAEFYSGHDTEAMDYRTEHPVLHPNHKVELDGFFPDRTVYYQIKIEDERGRTHESGIREFKTRENNVAWMKPVEGSFDQPPYGVDEDRLDPEERFVERITNGITNYTDGTATSGDPDVETQWFLIDLMDEYKIERYEFLWREFAYPQHYNLMTSTDPEGEEWTEQAMELNADDGDKELSEGGLPSIRHVVEPEYPDEPVQFIRVEIPRGASYHQYFPQYDFVQLLDFKAMEPEPEEVEPAAEEE